MMTLMEKIMVLADEIEKLIDAFGEERLKEMLSLRQGAYDELMQRIEDLK